ncbi:TPA: hypothetical protein JI077_05280 [Acinetobacter baumannii]|nr:hypothetical protein [Acinetobacter baumannii]
MKPEDYIRFSGLDKARNVVAASANALVQCFDGTTFHVNDLKRLVESLDLINKCGGIDEVERIYLPIPAEFELKFANLIQAIKDHESIYGGGQ